MNTDREPIDAVRRDRNAFDEALLALGCQIRGKSATCPWHDDKNPSASILESADGGWRLHCHRCDRGGDVFDLREQAGGRPVADQLREARAAAPGAPRPQSDARSVQPEPKLFASLDEIALKLGGTIESRYDYANPDGGTIELAIFRVRLSDGRKTFRQASPWRGAWRMEAPAKPWPLYNRAAMREADRVVVVEGEKCVEALRQAGIVATTSPCGAGKAKEADWTPLAGKTVYLWPDNDPKDPKTGKRTGIDHMRDVERILDALEPPVALFWLDCDTLGLPPKGDAADFIDAMDAADAPTLGAAVNEVLQTAQPLGPDAGVLALIEETIAGKRVAIPMPWKRLSAMSRALLPGTVTLLCGEAGSTKSFLLLELLAACHNAGHQVDVYELEEDRTYHLMRALAQRSGFANILDDGWVRENAAEARTIHHEHRDFLRTFGRRISEAPETQPTMDALIEWMRARVRAGSKVLAIDPITAADGGDKQWASDLRFMMAAKAIVREYDARLILVTHPTKTRNNGHGREVGMGDMAGGAAYSRFAQNILWLEAFSPPKSVLVGTESGVATASINRQITIQKARNGRGTGKRIGYHFNGGTMRLGEVGVVIPKGIAPDVDDVPRSRPGNHVPRGTRMASDPQASEDVLGQPPIPQQEP